MNSFFRELKQRKVYRVALGYAVVAWLVIQISATVMPAYHAPELILPIFITAAKRDVLINARTANGGTPVTVDMPPLTCSTM
jgi:hypothetical protein